MTPAGRIAPQPWMTAPATLAVLAALGAEGAPARFVGGCVRDAVLGRPVKDVDIATPLPPDRVVVLLERAGIKAVPTGIEHGTVTAVTGGAHFEITTLRTDLETDGRRARVAFTDDWMADAARRDFTVNAMFAAPDGTLFDPFGGIDDLEAGRIRFVGDAASRIREDVLRLLRFFRFHALYGRGEPDAAALSACAELAPLLPTLSGERVAGETLRLLGAPDPVPALRLMAERGVLAHFLPEARRLDRLAALVAIDAERGEPDPLRRLAAALAVDPAAAEAVARRLRLSNSERNRLVALAAGRERPTPALDAGERRRWVYRLGAARFRDLALLAQADAGAGAAEGTEQGAAARPAEWAALLAAAAWPPPALPVRGRDVLALGIAPGPRVQALLDEVEAWWLAGDFAADREACLAELARRAAATSSG